MGRACVARTRLRVDLRDTSGRQAGVRFLLRLPAEVLTGTQCHTGRIGNTSSCRIGHTSCCADFILSDSRHSRWKTSCGSSLRRPHAASALILDVTLEKGIPRSTFTNRLCRSDPASFRALSYLSNSSRTSVCIRKTSPSCVLLGFMCLALALSFPEHGSIPARERFKLGLRLPTTRSKLSL